MSALSASQLKQIVSAAMSDVTALSSGTPQDVPLRPGEWRCVACGTINFCRALASGRFFPRGRVECKKCRAVKPYEEEGHERHPAISRSRSKRKSKKKKKNKSSSSSSSDSSSSSSRDKKKKKKKKKRKQEICDGPLSAAAPPAPPGGVICLDDD
eukprot:gb/GFBE01076976.1/.p1 GENE.gb/GFBE01076976.1/~~gb/GFBE01076976.1/.p1  ORF type:complete len:155 (+),score=27.56 gb/GFBE01076976.1/:1-465(+)